MEGGRGDMTAAAISNGHDPFDSRNWIVPRGWRLSDLMADMRPAEALAQWWAETEPMFERMWAAERDGEVAADATAAMSEFAHIPSEPLQGVLTARRLSLVPLTRQGLSLRQIAFQTGLDEREVVGAVLNPRCQGNAGAYCDCDDDIRRGALDHQPVAALARKYGISRHAVTRLAVIAKEGL